jgi:DNA repair protein RecO (recombination protein O)
MIELAHGIILRTRPFTETSLIVNWLTAESGRISTVAKGARRPKSLFRGQLDLFHRADLSFVRSRRSDLHTLREVNLRETQPALRRDLGLLRQACYCAALIEQATETGTPLPAIYKLLVGFLEELPRHPPQPQAVFAFELQLLEELGLAPDLVESRLTAGTREIARVLTKSKWPQVVQLKPSRAQIAELRQFLHGFLIFHLGRIPRGRDGLFSQPAEPAPKIPADHP